MIRPSHARAFAWWMSAVAVRETFAVTHKYVSNIARGGRLDLAERTPRRIVHEGVNIAEHGIDLRDRVGVVNVHVVLGHEEAVGGVFRLQVIERAYAAGGGYVDLTLCEDYFGKSSS